MPISARSRRPVSELGVDRREQRARFLAVEHRRRPFFCDIFRAAHGMRRVHVEHMADHQPVKQHPQRRQVLFHGRLGKPCPSGSGRPSISI